jgi:transcriptional regulator with XRE-family HTH domain
LSGQLRAEGQSWAQIARSVQDQEHVNARVALRLAHGWTQEQVATRWNQQWPPREGSAGLTDKNISAWETWPQSGIQPSLKTLKRLAQLYQCDVGQLIEDADYRHLDEANHPREDGLNHVPVPAVRVPTARSAANFTQPLNQTVTLRDSQTPASQIEAIATLDTERPDKDLLAELADTSQEFGEWAATTEVSDAVIERYKDQIRCLARDFERAPPLPLLVETSQLCARVTSYIRSHQRPDQARELYLVAAQLYGLLAWMTGDLGSYRTADTHAWTAWVCADLAGHDGARAWVRATQAKLAYWDGRFGESAELARDGLRYRSVDAAPVILELFRGRALARAGDRSQAIQALHQTARRQDQVTASGLLGGIWDLSPARCHGLAAGVLTGLGDSREALAEAAQAVALSQATAPSRRNLFAEALFRSDLAAGHLGLHNLDGAAEALNPVLALPVEMRTEPVVQQVISLRHVLTRPAIAQAQLARDLGEQIGVYASEAPVNSGPPRQLPPVP